jgi:UDP-N-acetylmuramate--alanine ligase
LCKSIRVRGKVDPILVHDIEELTTSLPPLLQDGDLVLLMGAGSIEQLAQELRETGFIYGEAA